MHLTSRQKILSAKHTLPASLHKFNETSLAVFCQRGLPAKGFPDRLRLLKLTGGPTQLTARPVPAQHGRPHPPLHPRPFPLSQTFLCHRQHYGMAADPKEHPLQAERDGRARHLQEAHLRWRHPGRPRRLLGGRPQHHHPHPSVGDRGALLHTLLFCSPGI